MRNIITFPREGNRYPANPDIERLSLALDLARAEHAALLEYRLKRREFHRSRSLDAEAEMVAARDVWASTYVARHGVAA